MLLHHVFSTILNWLLLCLGRCPIDLYHLLRVRHRSAYLVKIGSAMFTQMIGRQDTEAPCDYLHEYKLFLDFIHIILYKCHVSV